MNYWEMCTLPLVEELSSNGWVVVFKPMPKVYGHCDYIKKQIAIDSRSGPKQQFLTLCHEAGHRRAFVKSQCSNWPRFKKKFPSRAFRELQAIVYGWTYARMYSNRVSQSFWLRENRSAMP